MATQENEVLTEDQKKLKTERRRRIRLQQKLAAQQKKTTVFIVLTAVLGVALAVSFFFLLRNGIQSFEEKSGGRLTKDYAITELAKSPLISVKSGDKGFQIKSMTEMFTLFKSSEWKRTSDRPVGEEAAVFTIGENYSLALIGENYAKITDGGSSRTYKIPSGVASDILKFIDDNSAMDTSDLTSLITQTDSVTLKSSYYSGTVTAGVGLARTLAPDMWEQLTFYPATGIPETVISAWDSVEIGIYDTDAVIGVSYNGNTVYYSMPENVPANLRGYVGQLLSYSAQNIRALLAGYSELTLESSEHVLNVIPEESFLGALSFDSWTRVLDTDEPVSAPSYLVTDGANVSLAFYGGEKLVRFNNGNEYYSVGEDTFTRIAAYINSHVPTDPVIPVTPDDPNPPQTTDTVLESFKAKIEALISAGGAVNCSTPSKSFLLKAKAELEDIILKNISEITDKKAEDTADKIILSVGSDTVTVYPEQNIAVIVTDGESSSYAADGDGIKNRIAVYAESNTVQKEITLSGEELCDVIQGKSKIITAIYSETTGSFARGNGNNAATVATWLKSLSPILLTSKPAVDQTFRTVLTCDGDFRTVITLYPADTGFVLNAVGRDDVNGLTYNSWYQVSGLNYSSAVETINAEADVMKDDAMRRFCSDLTSDAETVIKWFRTGTYDISKYLEFFGADIYKATYQKISDCRYTVVMTVGPTDVKGLTEGENSFTVTIAYSQASEDFYVSAMVPSAAEKLVNSVGNPEVQAVMKFISRCTAKPFAKPSDIEAKSVINYCMYMLRTYGDATKTVFTQAEIDAAAQKYFNLSTVSDTEMLNENGFYTVSSEAVPVAAVSLAALSSKKDTYEVTIGTVSDPLGLFSESRITYTVKKMTDTRIAGTPEEPVEELYDYYLIVSAKAAN